MIVEFSKRIIKLSGLLPIEQQNYRTQYKYDNYNLKIFFRKYFWERKVFENSIYTTHPTEFRLIHNQKEIIITII